MPADFIIGAALTNPMATYAIGDIQGCYREFETLLELIGFSPDRDRLWFVGDLVNRGPGSLEILRHVRDLGDAAVTVLGNHDFHLLRLAAGHGKHHHDDTLVAVLEAPDRDELIEWLARRPLAHREDRWLLIHAGLVPSWTAERTVELAREVEAVLSSDARGDFLDHLYGDLPNRWDDALEGFDRLRVIVNVLARLRFCAADDTMEFREKRGAAFAPEGMKAWFAQPNRASADHTVICGHWSTQDLMLAPNVWMLDSGCLWGGSLTAVRLEDRRVFQVPSLSPVSPKPFE
jgi:bis(5'-nucleosyl)-tetraphosphatase (symmetrical)